MGKIDTLFSNSKKIQNKIERVLRLEREIKEEEQTESAELEKAKKLASRLKSTDANERKEILEEEVNDFVEAVNLFRSIATELDNVADGIHGIIGEINSHSDEELQIVEGLATNSLKFHDEDKVKELAESLNTTQNNIDKLIKESQQAKKEAQKAQSELEQLLQLERFLQKVDEGKHDLSQPRETLNRAKGTLEDAEWKLGEVPDKIQRAKNKSQETVERVEANVDQKRRNIVKSTGAIGVAALTGLSGCKAPAANEEDVNMSYSNNYDEKLRKANPQDKNGEVDVGGSGKAHKFNVEDGETKWISINGREHAVEALTVTSKNAVIRLDNSSLVRVQKRDVLRLSGKGLEVRGTLQKGDGGLIVFEMTDGRKVNKGLKESGNENKIHPHDKYFVVGTGEKITFTFKAMENVIELRDVQSDRAAIRINGEIRQVSQGESIEFNSGNNSNKPAVIWVENIFFFGDGEGKVKISFKNPDQ